MWNKAGVKGQQPCLAEKNKNKECIETVDLYKRKQMYKKVLIATFDHHTVQLASWEIPTFGVVPCLACFNLL